MSQQTSLPTEGELEILRVLWDRGPSTVREVHERLAHLRAVGYTTVLKLLQIMHAKGLVTRDESERTHVYAAAAARAATERRLVRDLAERAFGGSAARLVLRALPDVPATPAEIEEIRALLRRLEEG
jgi:BlaI family transcriptional regulator, penicillinase repressor